jgi:hypothetical protein
MPAASKTKINMSMPEDKLLSVPLIAADISPSSRNYTVVSTSTLAATIALATSVIILLFASRPISLIRQYQGEILCHVYIWSVPHPIDTVKAFQSDKDKVYCRSCFVKQVIDVIRGILILLIKLFVPTSICTVACKVKDDFLIISRSIR